MSFDVWDAFPSTALFTWDHLGLPEALNGPWAAWSAETVHVVTAWNPDGVDVAAADNAEAHRRLVDEVEARGWDWAPAIGSSFDARHHEVSVLLRSVTRGQARRLGARFGQLAVFEVDEEWVHVVPCDGSEARRVERHPFDHHDDATAADLARWRAEHEEAAGRRLPRTACPRCGRLDPQRVVFGLPPGPPPDWLETGGCGSPEDDGATHLCCPRCTHAWRTGGLPEAYSDAIDGEGPR